MLTSPTPSVSDPTEHAPSHDFEVLENWFQLERQGLSGCLYFILLLTGLRSAI
jgi:hypothetical protein